MTAEGLIPATPLTPTLLARADEVDRIRDFFGWRAANPGRTQGDAAS